MSSPRRPLRGCAVRSLLLLIAPFLAGAAAVPAASAATLQGAGSELIKPLEADWANAWGPATVNTVNYVASGSLTGILDISARNVDFAASDAPMSPAQSASCGSCVQIPWGLTAVAIGFNLSNIRTLKLTGNVLAKIYLGKITNWNDTRIQRLNPRVSLPNETITPVYETGGTGESYPFSDYLSTVSTTWRTTVGRGLTISLPPPAVGVAGGDAGVIATVQQQQGAIGYAAASYLIPANIPAVAIRNQAGNYEFPNNGNIAAAAQEVTTVPADNAPDIVNPGAPDKLAYPISTFTYAIVPAAPLQATVLQSFFDYAIGPGQSFGYALDFAMMPAIVTKAAQNAIAAL